MERSASNGVARAGSGGLARGGDAAVDNTLDDRLRDLASAYNQHASAVFRLAGQMCGPEHAEEVTTQTFLRLRSTTDNLATADVASLRTPLLTLTHQQALSLLRDDDCRTARLKHMSPAEVEQEALARAGAKARGLLSELRPAQRQAIVLAYFGGHTCHQIADLLQKPHETVKAHIRDGLAQMQTLLEEGGAKRLAQTPTRWGNTSRHS